MSLHSVYKCKGFQTLSDYLVYVFEKLSGTLETFLRVLNIISVSLILIKYLKCGSCKNYNILKTL
jgi:hypothetical protein